MRESPSETPVGSRPVQPARHRTAWLVALLCVIWGSTWLVIRTGLRDLPPLTSAGARFLVAAATLGALAPALHRREGGDPPPLWLSAQVSLLSFAVPYGIVYWGETVIPSGLASVLWAIFPLLIAVGGHLYLPEERLRGRHWTGFVCAFLGVALLFLTDLREIAPGAIGVGAVFLLSPASSAISQTVLKRHAGSVSSVLLNRNALTGSAALLLGAGLVAERDATFVWSGPACFSIAYLAIVGTVVTFGLYFWLLRNAPSHRMSLIAYVTPAVALALGWAVGREPVRFHTLAGAGLILGGVALVLRPARRITRSAGP